MRGRENVPDHRRTRVDYDYVHSAVEAHTRLAYSDLCSVKELADDIQAWVDIWNEDPKHLVWHKTAEQIRERLAGYCSAINQGAAA